MTDDAEHLYERLLVIRCQTGDESAFRELVDRYTPRLAYYLRKTVPQRDRIDDLLQETWLDVFRQLPRLQSAAAFAVWVYRIARGKAARDWREQNRLPLASAQEEPASAEDEGPLFSPAQADRIHEALDRLTPDHREVLVLRFLEDLTYEEIAEVLGCQLGTVRSRLHYGKQALRRLLDSIEGS